MWSAMKHYSEKGKKAMDLGRNSLENQGLRKYKNTWGADEKLTHYHRHDLKKNQTIIMKDDVYGWHNAIFTRLPISVTKMIGSILYKHIA